PIYTVREQVLMPAAVRRAELLHVPHYNIPVLYRGRLVVTIHDVTHIQYPAYAKTLKSRIYGFPLLRYVVGRADHIITVSDYSRECMINKLGADPAKVTVVHCGVGPQFETNDREEAKDEVTRHGVRSPYLLYVGNLKPHKNLPSLLQAFRAVAKA